MFRPLQSVPVNAIMENGHFQRCPRSKQWGEKSMKTLAAILMILGLAVTTLKVRGLTLYRFVPMAIAYLARKVTGDTVEPEEGPSALPQVAVTIRDAEGRRNQSELRVWVAGGERPPSRDVEQEEITLIPEKEEYQPGETAALLVQSPFFPAEGLLSIRRDDPDLSHRLQGRGDGLPASRLQGAGDVRPLQPLFGQVLGADVADGGQGLLHPPGLALGLVLPLGPAAHQGLRQAGGAAQGIGLFQQGEERLGPQGLGGVEPTPDGGEHAFPPALVFHHGDAPGPFVLPSWVSRPGAEIHSFPPRVSTKHRDNL